jgi:tRNA(Met) C34 N-acetyltransferase TmcA
MSLIVEIYSEKAIVLRGAQDHHKAILEANKGMFNARLKNGAGWIFPKFMKNQIEALAEQINSGVDLSPPSSSKSSSEKAEPEVSKKEYLSLLSRVERLEALVAQLTRTTVPSSSVSAAALPPALEDLPVEDLELDFEEDMEPKKTLSKPKKAAVSKAPTVDSFKPKTLSKPKVNP